MKLPLPERHRKRIVIDADVARAASPSNSSVAGRCFDFMIVLRECKHKVVFSNELWEEWMGNRSGHAWTWMRTMRARKLVVRIAVPTDAGLREKFNRLAVNVGILDAMNKDIHLLEAAMATDSIIASKENEAHAHFAVVCDHIGEIRDVMWVNPVDEEDACAGWLKQGAPVKAARQLGFRQGER